MPSLSAEHFYHARVFDVSHEGGAPSRQFDAVHFSGETLVFEAKIAPRVDKNEVDKMAEIKNKTYDQYTTLFVGDGYFGDDA